MELWIRSQDKETLILVEHLDIYCDDEIEQIYCIEECGNDLGRYKSKERALEVLDEIQKLLQPQILCKKGKIIGSFDNTIYKENDRYEIQELSTYVYEMPKD